MRWTGRLLIAAAVAGLAGCVVVPTRRGLVVAPVPPPVVVAPAPPPPPPPDVVEVVPASPDPTFIWTPGWYFYDGYGVRHWHRGYWHHR